MLRHRSLLAFVFLALAGCALTPAGGSRSLPGSDDAAAGRALLDLLQAAGVPAEMASDEVSVFVYRKGMATLLSPIVQSEGMDRIVATRRYAPAPGRGDEELGALAGRLNDSLNVGVFSVDAGALVFQSQMTFIDRLAADELTAFLGWLDVAELAMTRIDGPGGVLLISE